MGTAVEDSEGLVGWAVGAVLDTEGVDVSGVLSRTTRLSVDSTMVMSTATMAMMAAMVPTMAGPVRYQGSRLLALLDHLREVALVLGRFGCLAHQGRSLTEERQLNCGITVEAKNSR